MFWILLRIPYEFNAVIMFYKLILLNVLSYDYVIRTLSQMLGSG